MKLNAPTHASPGDPFDTPSPQSSPSHIQLQPAQQPVAQQHLQTGTPSPQPLASRQIVDQTTTTLQSDDTYTINGHKLMKNGDIERSGGGFMRDTTRALVKMLIYLDQRVGQWIPVAELARVAELKAMAEVNLRLSRVMRDMNLERQDARKLETCWRRLPREMPSQTTVGEPGGPPHAIALTSSSSTKSIQPLQQMAVPHWARALLEPVAVTAPVMHNTPPPQRVALEPGKPFYISLEPPWKVWAEGKEGEDFRVKDLDQPQYAFIDALRVARKLGVLATQMPDICRVQQSQIKQIAFQLRAFLPEDSILLEPKLGRDRRYRLNLPAAAAPKRKQAIEDAEEHPAKRIKPSHIADNSNNDITPNVGALTNGQQPRPPRNEIHHIDGYELKGGEIRRPDRTLMADTHRPQVTMLIHLDKHFDQWFSISELMKVAQIHDPSQANGYLSRVAQELGLQKKRNLEGERCWKRGARDTVSQTQTTTAAQPGDLVFDAGGKIFLRRERPHKCGWTAIRPPCRRKSTTTSKRYTGRAKRGCLRSSSSRWAKGSGPSSSKRCRSFGPNS